MSECMERNPYNDDEQNEEKFDPEEYMECSQIDLPEEQRRRRLEDGQEEVSYYVGPYCANDGGQIPLGLFTDETCTMAATDIVFADLFGFDLPYEKTSLVKESCMQYIESLKTKRTTTTTETNKTKITSSNPAKHLRDVRKVRVRVVGRSARSTATPATTLKESRLSVETISLKLPRADLAPSPLPLL